MQKQTGLDYSDSDMTLGQIRNFVSEVRQLSRPKTFSHVYVTGGEPLLHPQVEEIVRLLEPLVTDGYIEHLHVNSNLILEAPPSLKSYVVNFTRPAQKPAIHNTVLWHPDDFGGKARTRQECSHYRKDTWVLSYLGFYLCCAGDGYARLFGRGDLFLNHLPASVEEFPDADAICLQCPFGSETPVPMEKSAGNPVSAVYGREVTKNWNGRKILARYPEYSGEGLPKIAWVCCTYGRPHMLGHVIHCFLQQDYPADRRYMLILDDAGQYDCQQGEGWELISIPRRFRTLGEKRNAATALLPRDVDIICPVDDDDMHLPHAMRAHAAALKNGDWSKPSRVYREMEPGVYRPSGYHGHSASWGYRADVYRRTTGYGFTNVGEDGGLQHQLTEMHLRIVDPIALGFEPYVLYGRFQQYQTHAFKPGDYERLTGGGKAELVIAPGYHKAGAEEYRKI